MKKILLLILLSIVAALLLWQYALPPKEQRLAVHFIDVGQGDATLIRTPKGKVMLIDAGNNEAGDTVVSYLRKLRIDHIDVLIGTHPDADHVGGMDIVIENFPVTSFYMPMKYHQTKTFDDVLRAAKKHRLRIQAAFRDQDLPFDEEVDTLFLSPVADKYYPDNNAYSAVVKLT